jgi:hypothetical protein
MQALLLKYRLSSFLNLRQIDQHGGNALAGLGAKDLGVKSVCVRDKEDGK